MIRLALAAGGAWLLLVAQADALSCLRPNLGEAFNRFQVSTDRYTLAVGRLTIRRGDIPKPVRGKAQTVRARISGRTLTPDGFGPSADGRITVRLACVASWCGGVPQTDQDLIFFLRHDGGQRVLDMHACPDGNAAVVTADRLDLLRRCLHAGKCSEKIQRAFDRY